ncbi:hypothetical protein FJT64_020688 [Amphibalanus amphitrite]|uniref:Uncharacterized protein n=1 Tax=Amphibalanus amphitrite TaxID=1232801 RepID=A0A6A4WKV2_AMPAM|nr:hypothetical protein FJT64_020688 [Amphibalanus amphitrite]
MIGLKMAFAAVQISAGLSAIGARLRAVADGERPATHSELHTLRTVQDDLSRAFARLTDVMCPELILFMLSGLLQLIALVMLTIGSVQSGTAGNHAASIVSYALGAAVAVALPCELSQLVLSAVGETRDLLLRPRWQRPELFQLLCLFRETVGRDLTALGDLGLFRLQRSTLLALAATVLTYVIVLFQFYITSPTGDGADLSQQQNWTASPANRTDG